jgi:hypothetical protein
VRQYHFVVYGTVTDQGHIEFHIEDDEETFFPDGAIYENGDWQTVDEETRDYANIDLLRRTLEKRIGR